MKHFYKFMKIYLLIADLFVAFGFSILLFSLILKEDYDQLPTVIILLMIFAFFGGIIEFGLLKYYGDVVIDIKYSGTDVVLITYKKPITLPGEYFYEVKEDIGIARTFIKYDDGKFAKKYIFHMKKYSPFKTYHLDIAEMQKHMPNAIFN